MKSIDKFILPLGLFLVSIFYVPWLWYPFNWGKWSLIHLLATACFVRWTAMGMPFPKCKKWEAALFGFVALFAMGQAVLKSNLFVFCDRLSFFIILLYAYACLKEKKLQLKDFYWSIALSIFCLVTIGLYQVAQVFSYQELQQKNIGSIFGFSNNAAQSLVAMLGVLAWLSNTGKRKIYLIIILVASIVYLYFLQSRSIYISISIGVFAYALGYLYTLKKRAFFFGFIGLGLMIASLGVFYQKKIDSVLLEKLPFSKGSMIDWREDLWSRSLPMIRDFPLGLGPFRYEFAYVPYLRGGIAISEQNSPDNPHNEFLRFLIEDGVLFAPVYLVAIVVLVVSAISIFSPSILFLIGFYFSEMFFQFIWMNPYTFFLGSIFFAFCLSVRQQRTFQILKNEIVKKIVIICLELTMIIAIAARQTEASTQLDLVSVSCKLVPLHWRACLQKARIEMAERKLDDARITVLNTLELDPWNFSALKHMANIAFQQNRPVEGCFYLWKYEDIFRVNESAPSTTMTLRYEQNCPERVREYLKKNRPKRYLR